MVNVLGAVAKASESPRSKGFFPTGGGGSKMFCGRVVGRRFKDGISGLSMTRLDRIACASCQQCLG